MRLGAHLGGISAPGGRVPSDRRGGVCHAWVIVVCYDLELHSASVTSMVVGAGQGGRRDRTDS